MSSTIPTCPRCGPRSLRLRELDGSLWCSCGTEIEAAPMRHDDALERLRAMVSEHAGDSPHVIRGKHRIGRRQQLIVDYLEQHGPSKVYTVASGLVFPPNDVRDALHGIRARGLVRETTGAELWTVQVWEVVG